MSGYHSLFVGNDQSESKKEFDFCFWNVQGLSFHSTRKELVFMSDFLLHVLLLDDII